MDKSAGGLRVTAGGDGARRSDVVGHSLAPGLEAVPLTTAPDTVRIAGTPSLSGMNYVYARVTDADGDPAWRIFTFYVAGGPGTLVEADLRGTDPALHTPWTPTYALGASVGSYSGLQLGPGALPAAGNDALTFTVSAPPTMSTLAEAVQDGEYVALTVQAAAGSSLNLRQGELRFTIDRVDYHSPRSYAVFTSVGGFAAGQEVFVSPQVWETGEPREFSIPLPDEAAYEGLTGPEIRIYGEGAQYDGHRIRLTGLKLRARIP